MSPVLEPPCAGAAVVKRAKGEREREREGVRMIQMQEFGMQGEVYFAE